MAAPSGTTWGSIYGSKGKLGIYTNISSTNTQTTVNVQIWFWTIYGCYDTGNTLYYNVGTNVTSATTSQGAVSINHTVSSGGGWSTSNQTKILDKTYTYTRGTSASTYKVYVKLTNIDYVGATLHANKSYTVPALASYTVSYNANGGSGAPSSQTKWYGKTLTLSSTKPTRTGYSFQGWGTSSSDTSVDYSAGASYTSNAAITLYAIWKANTYTVSYNANGGSGAPSSQTKTYGVALTLSSTKPTRTNYNFLGWGISASSTTVTYNSGASYTSNAAITLYAIWELAYKAPRINVTTLQRCTSGGTASESGTYFKVLFSWETDEPVTSVIIKHKAINTEEWYTTTISTSGTTSGTVSRITGSALVTVDRSYDVQITVSDSQGSTVVNKILPSQIYLIDFLSTGNGTAIGKAAELEDTFDVNWKSQFRNHLMVGEKEGYYDGKTGVYIGKEGLIHIQRSSDNNYNPYISFIIDDGTASQGTIQLNSTTLAMEFKVAQDYIFSVKSVNATYTPYYKKGDTITFDIFTAGYITSGAEAVCFYVPFAKPIIGSPSVTVASTDGFILRQEGKYTHGCGSTTWITPTKYNAYILGAGNFVRITAFFDNTTNTLNNAPIGINWVGTVTFS
jgi:uncharacterized repeat protein (TIGR02543 family)